MMFHGCSPWMRSQAVREVRVWVLPEPGPARIARVSAEEETAARWALLRLERRVSRCIVFRCD